MRLAPGAGLCRVGCRGSLPGSLPFAWPAGDPHSGRPGEDFWAHSGVGRLIPMLIGRTPEFFLGLTLNLEVEDLVANIV